MENSTVITQQFWLEEPSLPVSARRAFITAYTFIRCGQTHTWWRCKPKRCVVLYYNAVGKICSLVYEHNSVNPSPRLYISKHDCNCMLTWCHLALHFHISDRQTDICVSVTDLEVSNDILPLCLTAVTIMLKIKLHAWNWSVPAHTCSCCFIWVVRIKQSWSQQMCISALVYQMQGSRKTNMVAVCVMPKAFIRPASIFGCVVCIPLLC